MKSLFFILIALNYTCTAQQLTAKDAIWKHIEERNKLISEAFIEGNVNKIIENYMQDATIMPEHTTSRKNTIAINKYYTDWLTAAKMNSFTKTIYEVQDFDGYALEIGTFTQNFTLNGGKPFEYKGKYMVLWRTSLKLDTCWIEAEIWGANDYINDADFPDIANVPAPKFHQPESIIKKEVENRNQVIAKLVTERKGAEHATLFMPDAIYMTYYIPMLIGMDKIKPYFTEHEKPGTLKIEAIQINTDVLYATAGGPVVEFGSYKVDWSDGDKKGTVTGKSINVWKRDADGILMMYRQMVNHD